MRPFVTSQVLRRFGAFIMRLGTTAGLIAAVNWLFDYPFSGWAVWHFGPLYGGIIIVTIALVLNYGIVLWYRTTKSDWFGMEWLRAQEALHSPAWSGRIVRLLLRKSRLLAFTAIAVLLDPIYAFIYQRGRITGTQLTVGDWWWFGLANVMGILPWMVGVTAVIETAKRAIT
jgi:hypothetical protein